MFQAILNSRSIDSSNHRSKYLFLATVHSLWLSLGLIFSSDSVRSQTVVRINQNTVAKPLILTGKSGGSIKIKQIASTENTSTGYCDGYVNSLPNHLLKLESFFELLKLEVRSNSDTTVLVKGASGVWCNDDSGSANPMIEGQWQAGLYKVWVGSYQPNAQHNYQIKLTGR